MRYAISPLSHYALYVARLALSHIFTQPLCSHTGTIYVGIVNSLLTIIRVSELNMSSYGGQALFCHQALYGYVKMKIHERVKNRQKRAKSIRIQYPTRILLLHFLNLQCFTYG
jgi:hypothetical protein